jgi:tyrosine-protein phosphatase YwqE
MIPDFIERKLYINIAKIVVGVMTETLQSTHIKLLGHDIAFSMKPDVHNLETKPVQALQALPKK